MAQAGRYGYLLLQQRKAKEKTPATSYQFPDSAREKVTEIFSSSAHTEFTFILRHVLSGSDGFQHSQSSSLTGHYGVHEELGFSKLIEPSPEHADITEMMEDDGCPKRKGSTSGERV